MVPAHAVLVDHDSAAEAAVRANLSTTGFDAVATFVRSPVGARSCGAGAPAGPFDLVFLDPPYDVPSDRASRRCWSSLAAGHRG